MGFTIEDMLVSSKDKYRMELLAGENGWANSISWLLMVEDTTIIQNFNGKELVVTTGVGFDTKEKLLDLVQLLYKRHASGLIINTGFYIMEVPPEVIEAADKCDLPLLTVPWDIAMSDMIKDLTVRIFLQSETDRQISDAFIRLLEHPEASAECRDIIASAYDVDGKFQVTALTTKELDRMDTRDRRRIEYQLAINLANISHNAQFLYYNGCFLLIMNEVDEASGREILDGFIRRARRRMPEHTVYIGEGSTVTDISRLYISYQRALYAVQTAMRTAEPHKRFDELGMNRLLYSVKDPLILKEMGPDLLAPLVAYDKRHAAELLPTLISYLDHNGSINQVAEDLFTHKNTILYRMGKIREVLGCDLSDGRDRMKYYVAALIYQEQQ